METEIDYCTCPYCGSDNTDFVDEDAESEKRICRDCGEDYIFWFEDKEFTTRNNFPIK